jgi:hypothetical protein
MGDFGAERWSKQRASDPEVPEVGHAGFGDGCRPDHPGRAHPCEARIRTQFMTIKFTVLSFKALNKDPYEACVKNIATEQTGDQLAGQCLDFSKESRLRGCRYKTRHHSLSYARFLMNAIAGRRNPNLDFPKACRK